MKKLLYLVLLLLIGQDISASPYTGGEITWECLPNGNFRFMLVLYRDCAFIQFPNSLTLQSNSPAGNISLDLYPNSIAGKKDISPDCNSSPLLQHIECATTPFGGLYAYSGAIEKWTYSSDQDYPNGVQLQGVPPPSGWYFAYESCCRNPNTSIPFATSFSYFIRAVMYPYNGNNAYPCFDSSPQFLDDPETVICLGYPYSYNHKAIDPDIDSLSFEWAPPLDGDMNSPIQTYNLGYSAYSPFPGTFHNPNNVPASVDPATGEITLTSYTTGVFVNVLKVTSYREGVKIAEVFRELQTIIDTCGNNLPPQIGIYDLNTSQLLSQRSPNTFVDTVFIGENLSYQVWGVDTSPTFLPNGQLASVLLDAYGQQFGQNFSSTTSGCPFPPCATLSPAPPLLNQFGLSTEFDWNVSLNHIAQGDSTLSYQFGNVPEAVYDFYFKMRDDFCPVPGQGNVQLRLYIRGDMVGGVSINNEHCLVQDLNKDVSLNWAAVTDPDNQFLEYIVYQKQNTSSPFQPIYSTTNILDTSFTHINGAPASHIAEYSVTAVIELLGDTVEVPIFRDSTCQVKFSLQEVCSDETFYMRLKGGFADYDSINWDFGSFHVIHGSGAGEYKLRPDSTGLLPVSAMVYSPCGVTYVQNEILVLPAPDIKISGPHYVCPGQPLVLSASGGDHYYWNVGIAGPNISLTNINSPTTLTVTVWDSLLSCEASKSIDIRMMEPYENSSICLVSTDIQGQMNQLELTHDPIENIQEYILFFRENNLGQWDTLASLESTQSLLMDTLNSPADGQYFYAVQVMDSCGQLSSISPASAPPNLSVNLVNNEAQLTWLPLVGGNADVIRIFKQSSPASSFSEIQTLNVSQTTYSEIVDPNLYARYVVGYEGELCAHHGSTAISYSNAVSINDVGLDENVSDRCELLIFNEGDNSRMQITWVNGPPEESVLEIHDLLGRKLFELEMGKEISEVVNLGPMHEGVLLYSIYNKDGVIFKGKFLR